MNNFFGRISENVLFAVLITAVVGWTALSVAASPAASAFSRRERGLISPLAHIVGEGQGEVAGGNKG